MSYRLRQSLALLLLTASSSIVASGCGESEPPPVEVQDIDFEEAEDQATKEYE